LHHCPLTLLVGLEMATAALKYGVLEAGSGVPQLLQHSRGCPSQLEVGVDVLCKEEETSSSQEALSLQTTPDLSEG